MKLQSSCLNLSDYIESGDIFLTISPEHVNENVISYSKCTDCPVRLCLVNDSDGEIIMKKSYYLANRAAVLRAIKQYEEDINELMDDPGHSVVLIIVDELERELEG